MSDRDSMRQVLRSWGVQHIPHDNLHVLSKVPVDFHMPWQEAINRVGPNTSHDDEVRKVEARFETWKFGGERGKMVSDYVFLSGEQLNYRLVCESARDQGLLLTEPHEAFAIAQNNPNLDDELGANPMYLVATSARSFDGAGMACFAKWYGHQRGAGIEYTSAFTNDLYWFLFRRP